MPAVIDATETERAAAEANGIGCAGRGCATGMRVGPARHATRARRTMRATITTGKVATCSG